MEKWIIYWNNGTTSTFESENSYKAARHIAGTYYPGEKLQKELFGYYPESEKQPEWTNGKWVITK